MNFLKQLIDLILYSNLFIGLCAAAMTWQTFLLLGNPEKDFELILLVFFCTMIIYALHRLIGLKKVSEFLEVERYRVIEGHKSHIWVYAGLAMIGAGICFLLVSLEVKIALVIPGIISFLYVLPVLGGRRKLRLRDLDFIKIFLIALVWAYVTVALPALEMGIAWNAQIWMMFVERGIFILAITLPFDIRDLKVDAHNAVKTIPGKIGIKGTLWIAGLSMFLFLTLAFANYPYEVLPAFILTFFITLGLILASAKQENDYYFSGIMDGTMILQALLVFLFIYLAF